MGLQTVAVLALALVSLVHMDSASSLGGFDAIVCCTAGLALGRFSEVKPLTEQYSFATSPK